MPQFDPSIPSSVVKQVIADHGNVPSNWNDELQDLLSPSISARPLHLPESTRIKEKKNKEFHYHWAFDRCGSDPRHDRVERLRGAGWDYAGTADVEMCSSDTIKNKNEIRIGDLRLMKIPLMRWREIRKAQNLAALEQISPRRAGSGPMSLESMTPGMNHYMGDDAEIRAGAQIGSVEVENGQVKSVTGNASVAHVK
jgi:hypothetical protein